LKQIVLACHTYHDQQGHLPPGMDGSPAAYPAYNTAYNGFGNLQWHLLPFVEEGGLWNDSMHSTNQNLGIAWGAGPQSSSWNGAPGASGVGGNWGWNGVKYQYIAPEKVFLCPSDPATTADGWARNQFGAWAAGNYGANYQTFGSPNLYGNAGAWWPNWNGQMNLSMITDGTSKTIAFAEKYGTCNGYYASPSNQASPGPTPGSTGGSLNQWWMHQGVQWSTSIAACWAGPNGTDAWTGPVQSAKFQVLPVWNGTTNAANIPFCIMGLAQSPHPTIIQAGFFDGTVRPINQTVLPTVWWALMTPNGQEGISTGDF